MSDIPGWLNDTVRNFGHQMGLEQFSLNEKGSAALKFENGILMALEFGHESMVMSLRIAMHPGLDALKKLLARAHYSLSPYPVRAYYLERAGQGGCSIIIPESQVSVPALENAFQVLWKHVDYLKRNI